MKLSEFRMLIKETFLELFNEDEEIRDVVLEFVQENANIINESKNETPKKPADPELYDALTLIASGRQAEMFYKGKTIKTPNYGAGFQSGKMIHEWAKKAYTKIGGEWQKDSQIEDQTGVRQDTLSFLSSMGGGEGDLRSLAGNEAVLREQIVQSGRGEMMALTENGEFDPHNSVDISSLLVDTANTTLQNFPSSHEQNGAQMGIAAQKEAFVGTPEQTFGESANNWAHLAFQGLGSDK